MVLVIKQYTLIAELVCKPKPSHARKFLPGTMSPPCIYLCDLTDEKGHSLDVVCASSGQLINTEVECMPHCSDHFYQLLTEPFISLDPNIKMTAELTHSAQNDSGNLLLMKSRDVKKI